MTIFLDANDNEFIAQTNIKVTHGVNGEDSITGEIFDNKAVLQGIDRGWRLKFEDEYFYITYQKIRDENRSVSVEFDAVHQFFWDFSKSAVYEERDGTIKFEECLDLIFKDSGYRYHIDPNLESRKFVKQNFGMKDRMSLFNSIISDAGVEFNVKGKLVSIYKEVGTDLSTVVRKNLNLNELKITRNIGNFITYQKGLGKWNDENDHSKGRLTVEYESPLAQVYGRLEGPPFSDERYTVAENLLPVIKKNVESSYSLSVEMSIEDLTRAGYAYTRPHEGDYIMVINDILGFRRRVRIVSYASSYDVRGNLIGHQVTCNDIGAVQRKDVGYTALVNKVKASDQSTAQALEIANRALVSADGKSTNYYGDTFPADNPKGTLSKGDLFYQQVGDRTIMHVWNGKEWIADPVVNDAEKFREELDNEIAQVTAQIEANSAEHDRHVADIRAQATDAKTLAQQAQQIGNQAKMDAANSIAQALQAKADAIAEAQRLDIAERQATEGKLATAKSQAVAEANRLIEVAKSLLAGQIDGVSTELTQTKENIKLLATRDTVDALTGRVSSAESSLQIQASEIASCVKTSDFDQAKQRITSAESSITQLVNRITTEISETKSLIPKSVGGVNLLLNSSFEQTTTTTAFVVNGQSYDKGAKNWGAYNANISNATTSYHAYVGEGGGRQNVGIFNESNSGRNWKAFWQQIQTRMPQTTDHFMFSVDVLASSVGTKLFGGIYYYDKTGKANFHSGQFNLSIDATAGWHRLSAKVPFDRSKCDFSKTILFYVYGYGFTTSSILYIDKLKLEIGEIATAHTAAPEELISEITDVKTKISQTAKGQEQLSTRLSQTEGKVTTAETNIRQLINDVSSKVKQRDFDTATGRITNAETLIRQHTDKIASLVTKADFNSATGRLSTLETSVEQQAGEISKRLTSTQVEQAITDKGYQTKAQVDSNITGRGYITSSALQPYATTTTLQNLVTETAGSFERSITETKALIPTSISHRNLAIGSTENWTEFTSITKNNNWFKKMVDIPFGDSTGVYEGTKVNVYVHISVDDVVLDPSVKPRIILQGPGIRKSDGTDVWGNQYNPIHGKFVDTNLKSGNNYRIIKVSGVVTKDAVETCKAFGAWVRVDGVKSGKFHWRGLTVTTGDVAPDYWTQPIEDTVTQTVFNTVKETVEGHQRVIGNGIEISQAIQTAKGLLQEVSGADGLKSQMSQLAGSWAAKNLTSAGTVLNQLNLNKDGSVKIDGKLVQITGTTYIQDGVITSAKIASLDAAKITAGTLDASKLNVINLNASKIVGLDANFIKAKIETAMIDWMQGKTISAKNNAMQINLNQANIAFNQNATIDFNSGSNALARRRGTHTAFLHFQDEAQGGVYAGLGVTSSGDGINSQSSGRFAGVRIYRTAKGGTNSTQHESAVDEVQLFGDQIKFFDDFSQISTRGLVISPTSFKKVLSFTDLVKTVIACAELWQHFINANPNELHKLIHNSSNSKVNNSVTYLGYKDALIGSVV